MPRGKKNVVVEEIIDELDLSVEQQHVLEELEEEEKNEQNKSRSS